MKVCKDCKIEKPLSEFYRHPEMADGHLGNCKQCKREYAEAHQKEKMLDPEWAAAEAERQRRKASKRYHLKRKHDPEYRKKRLEYRRSYVARYPEKTRARNTLGNAVRDGRVKKGTECESCGEKQRLLHGHHDDYSKPLDVHWLCARCHGKRHRTR